ncbi:hypothetical protein L2E82_11554 [Cichorium intybus]|uniref:Uncharacterized protein n=1 Tax=Cichorium intybus TaxID=13427 RepID=A0ACB9GDH8_CICIN|nr:hypothetical protein L2E82_11554 [Cichorium intybus]
MDVLIASSFFTSWASSTTALLSHKHVNFEALMIPPILGVVAEEPEKIALTYRDVSANILDTELLTT